MRCTHGAAEFLRDPSVEPFVNVCRSVGEKDLRATACKTGADRQDFQYRSGGGLEVQTPSQWIRFQSKGLRKLRAVWKRLHET